MPAKKEPPAGKAGGGVTARNRADHFASNSTTPQTGRASNAERAAAAEADIRQRLGGLELAEHSGEYKAAFQFCRIAQGALKRQRLKAKDPEPLEEIAREFAEENSLDADLFFENVAVRWGGIKVPEGFDVVAEAARRAREENRRELAGKWITPSFKADAEITLAVCEALGALGDADGRFFLSCRSLAEVLGCDAYRAARILKDLCARGHLKLDGKATTRRAQRYRLPCDRDTENTETQRHREYREYREHRAPPRGRC